jgi:hypothetical protein
MPPSVRAITLRFPPRIYSTDRTDPRRMRHDCGVDPDLRGGVHPLRGRRGARSDQALIAARGARSHRLEHGAVAPRDEAAVTALAPGSLRLKR